MLATSTPVGHSRLQPLHDTHKSNVSNIAGDVRASRPSWPDNASRSEFARPRVKCCSSSVTRYEGHIVPASNFRQCPLLLHISTAAAKTRPRVSEPTSSSDQASPVAIGGVT